MSLTKSGHELRHNCDCTRVGLISLVHILTKVAMSLELEDDGLADLVKVCLKASQYVIF